MSNTLKGHSFRNRYRIAFVLTATSPFHLGNGETTDRPDLINDNKPVEITAVATDYTGRAYIPGSSLKGVLRAYLFDLMSSNKQLAAEGDYEDSAYQDQSNQLTYLKDKASLWELLFGSPFGEGKIEVSDGMCISPLPNVSPGVTENVPPWWKAEGMTYVDHSIAIDPQERTAIDGRLYHFEVVPAGVSFRCFIDGQNLTLLELGLLMQALEAFNCNIWPVTLGAMEGRDFGRFSMQIGKIFRLTNENLEQWKTGALSCDKAGYSSLPELSEGENGEKELCLKEARKAFSDFIAMHTPISGKGMLPVLKVSWNLNLETPLSIKSGANSVMKSNGGNKTRYINMCYIWNRQRKSAENEADISEAVYALKLENGRILPYGSAPSAGLRGALRSWTIRHLVKAENRKLLDRIKEPSDSVMNGQTEPFKTRLKAALSHDAILMYISDLFGIAVEEGGNSADALSQAGRIRVEVKPFSSNGKGLSIPGDTTPLMGGPDNVSRHIKERGPIDRITGGARAGGLHYGVEFSPNQAMQVILTVKNPNTTDLEFFELWKKNIDDGFLRLGGLWSIGRGRLKILACDYELQVIRGGACEISDGLAPESDSGFGIWEKHRIKTPSSEFNTIKKLLSLPANALTAEVSQGG